MAGGGGACRVSFQALAPAAARSVLSTRRQPPVDQFGGLVAAGRQARVVGDDQAGAA